MGQPLSNHHQEQARQQVRWMVRAALFAALTATGALLAIPIPISTVPLTLQVMFTLMAGLLLGGRAGAFSQFVYIIMGAVGMPVFSKGTAGMGVLLGPTGGYLIGFILAAGITGSIAGIIRTLTTHVVARTAGYLVASTAGLAVIYIIGTWRLSLALHSDLIQAMVVGVIPFMIPDLLKAVAAAFLTIALERRGLGLS